MTSSRCACGYSVTSLGHDPMQSWTTFECRAPNCHTVIRERIGATGSQFCRFCRERGVELHAKTVAPSPHGPNITMEEFGVELYKCITLCAQRQQIRQDYRHLVTNLNVKPAERKRRLDALTQREEALTKQIEVLFPKLNDADAARLFRQYDAVTV